MKKKKKTKSKKRVDLREKVLELLSDSRIHPTVERVHQKLKKKIKGVSKSAIKRHLLSLKQEGKIWELDIGVGVSRYSAASYFHYHFVCNDCQNIYDIRIPTMRNLDERVMQLTGFRIISHRLAFFGLCDICKLKKHPKNQKKQSIKR